jgi:hypothetical protein
VLSSFVHVPLIRKMDKRCGIRFAEVIRTLDLHGSLDHRFELDVEGHTGTLATVSIRLSIKRRGSVPTSWSLALLIHDERFDGIDYESHFKDWKGNRRVGWHRHVWDSDGLHGDTRKALMVLTPLQSSQISYVTHVRVWDYC